jgi:hypothetical protein
LLFHSQVPLTHWVDAFSIWMWFVSVIYDVKMLCID